LAARRRGCIVVGDGASVVQAENVASEAPAPTGGTIPDGTYYATRTSRFSRPARRPTAARAFDTFSSDGTTVTLYTSSPPFTSLTFTKQ
jgi:hypothetical protein